MADAIPKAVGYYRNIYSKWYYKCSKFLDSCASGICQNPEFVSNLLNTFESFASESSVSSTAGKMCCSLLLTLSALLHQH